MEKPRLRTVEKYAPPFPLNRFPKDFAVGLGKEIVYLLATRQKAELEGSEWERIFASLIGARWKPSNAGLDDLVLEQTAWGAKSVKATSPAKSKVVRLISGRNSPVYSFGDKQIVDRDPVELGMKILAIWNERVAGIKRNYQHLRTVVLIKAEDLLELAAFEFDTVMFDHDRFDWGWNRNNNLTGHCKESGQLKFTWQPSGSQFTISEKVPSSRLAIRIRQPPSLNRDDVLKTLDFDRSWVEIIK